jgi:hypothetical protein
MDRPTHPTDYLRGLFSRPWSRDDYDFFIKFLGILAAILLFGMRECRTRETVAAGKRLKEDEMTMLRIENLGEFDRIKRDLKEADSMAADPRRVEAIMNEINFASRKYERKLARLKFRNHYSDSLLLDHKAQIKRLRSFLDDFDGFKNRYAFYASRVSEEEIAPQAAIDSLFKVKPDERTTELLRKQAHKIFAAPRYLVPFYQYVLQSFYNEVDLTRENLITDGKKVLAVEGIGLQSARELQTGIPFLD